MLFINVTICMKIYDGAMLHGVNKQNIIPGELGEVVSLDLGMIPEDVINEKVVPLIIQLNEILQQHEVYLWITTGSHEDENTDNEV